MATPTPRPTAVVEPAALAQATVEVKEEKKDFHEAIIPLANLISKGEDTTEWLEQFQSHTIFWCSQVLAGVAPFPPKCRDRLADESTLIEKLPAIIKTWR